MTGEGWSTNNEMEFEGRLGKRKNRGKNAG